MKISVRDTNLYFVGMLHFGSRSLSGFEHSAYVVARELACVV